MRRLQAQVRRRYTPSALHPHSSRGEDRPPYMKRPPGCPLDDSQRIRLFLSVAPCSTALSSRWGQVGTEILVWFCSTGTIPPTPIITPRSQTKTNMTAPDGKNWANLHFRIEHKLIDAITSDGCNVALIGADIAGTGGTSTF